MKRKELAIFILVGVILFSTIGVLVALDDGKGREDAKTRRAEVVLSSTTTTTVPETTLPPAETKPTSQIAKPAPSSNDAMIKKCAQGFYDALSYYDAYRLAFNSMMTAKVLQDDQIEADAIKEREEIEVIVGQLYQVLKDSCDSYVGNRWLDNRWG